MSAGILWLIYVIKSYINRNDYETAIKSKDWQNNLRYSVNFSPFRSYFLAFLLIMFALFLVYIKFKKT